MNLSEIEYTTRPMTLGEWRLILRVTDSVVAGIFDAEALSRVIVARTNLTEEEADGLDLTDAVTVLTGISSAFQASVTLQKLGEQL